MSQPPTIWSYPLHRALVEMWHESRIQPPIGGVALSRVFRQHKMQAPSDDATYETWLARK